MPQFKYVAKDKDGRTVSGVMEAANNITLVDSLRQKEYIIISLEEAKGKTRSSPFGGGERIKLDELVVFSRQLATMVDAGIPLVGALDALQEQMESKGFKTIVKRVRDNVEGGLSLNKLIKKLLAKALGLSSARTDRRKDFDPFCGVWSPKEAASFRKAIQELERVDPKDWA